MVLFISSACKKEAFKFKEAHNLSVMSFNLRYDTEEDGENQWSNRKEAIIKMLQSEKPSVFGIQEGLYHQVSFMDDELANYNYVGVGRDDGYSGGEYSAIFYDTEQFEVLETNSFWLSETPEYPSMGWDANNIRIVTWVKLKDFIHQKEIFVFNTHFDHKGKTAQLESGKLLCEKMKEIVPENTAVFLTGDLNVLIRNKALKPIIDNYYSARRYASYTDKIKSFNFFGRWYFSRNIDFIFYDNAEALAFRTINDDYGVPYISDHYPIITHFNY
jgi:endonuclease/exonuclease/phosphatase family metal-dependent hydrolase